MPFRIRLGLPADVRAAARQNHPLWQGNAFHPSLHFKPIGQPN